MRETESKLEKEIEAANEKLSEFKFEFHQPLILLNELIYNNSDGLDKVTKTEIDAILAELNKMWEL